MRQFNIIKALRDSGLIDHPFNSNNFLLLLSCRLIDNHIWYDFDGCYMMIDVKDVDIFYILFRETIEYYFDIEFNNVDSYLDLISEL